MRTVGPEATPELRGRGGSPSRCVMNLSRLDLDSSNFVGVRYLVSNIFAGFKGNTDHIKTVVAFNPEASEQLVTPALNWSGSIIVWSSRILKLSL